MNSKVGQVTLWNYNFGSVLQCYATQQIVRKLGCECELLYRKESGFRKILYLLEERTTGYLKYLKYPQYIKRFHKLRASTKRKSSNMLSEPNVQAIRLFISTEIISYGKSFSELKKDGKSNKYIAYLSGSDQVWSGSWFVPNPVYFLRFTSKEKRIAWSPSFGTNHVDVYNRKDFKNYISGFAFLSAREQSGVKVIENLTNRKAVQILDPTLVMTEKQWRNRLNKMESKFNEKDYILLFFLDTPSEKAIASLKELQLDTGCPVISFGYEHGQFKTIENIRHMDGSPWLFLRLIEGAVTVLTDSFHAIAFSIQFQVLFYCFRRQYTHPADQSERIISLLDICNLNNHMIESEMQIDSGEKIDFRQINKMLEYKRGQSLIYLESALQKIKEQSCDNIKR